MNDLSSLQAGIQARMKSRSMGLKLMVVCVLALIMVIPALFVEGLISERSQRAAEVVKEISDQVGGQMTFLGPTLAIPYTIPPHSPTEAAAHGVYVVFPARASAQAKTSTQERRRSLFKVPVFETDLQLGGDFDLSGTPANAPQGAELDWSHAEILVGVNDARGALADATLTADGKAATLAPAEVADSFWMKSGQGEAPDKLTLFSVDAGELAKPDARFSVTSALRFSGAQRLAVLAYGKTTHLVVNGDWPNPSFDGGFLPVNRSVTDHGFAAEWSVPFIARGVAAEGRSDVINGLSATALGVSFVEMADPYQSVTRSMKYVLLFLGLIFLSYFIFEATTGKRVHPAQYILVGVAQIIFYLLLLSLAERIGFDFAFLAAGLATVGLLSANAGWIFASRREGLKALAVFTLLYTLIYMLLRLEDNALLVGAIASFMAVAAAMYLTRRIDWYSSMQVKDATQERAAPERPA